MVIHARIRSWNQPVLSYEGKVFCSWIQQYILIELELTTDQLRVRRNTHCSTPPHTLSCYPCVRLSVRPRQHLELMGLYVAWKLLVN